MIRKFINFVCFISAFVLTVDCHADQTADMMAIAGESYGSVMGRAPDNTQCATAIFANALRTSAESGAIDENAHETDMQTWIYSVFGNVDVLRNVLNCPEIASAPDDEIIKFIPIEYVFPNGRQIVINYESQPNIFKQRLIMADKRDLPAGPDSADLTDGNATWVNVDPAWYAIMVVEHGALDAFVGPDKNNTVSLKYINDNIDDLYPRGAMCTSKTAIARDANAINRAVTNTVGIKETTGESDSNDYYVAGDKDLGWIMYAEIALDVVISVVTMGTGTAIIGAAKGARAVKVVKDLTKMIKVLRETDKVKDYIQTTTRIAQLTKQIEKLDKVADATKIADLTKDIDRLKDTVKELEKTEDVAQYVKAMQSLEQVNKLRHEYKGMRALWGAKRGNVATRLFRTFKGVKSAMGGTKTLNRGARIARSGTFSARAKDWLFHSTMRNLAKLGKVEAAGGALYAILKFGGEMWDYTETSTGDFTNNIEFKPLLLLSADDIPGQENVINYGMWLMWLGDSISDADDDAAYLQAMDFAAKFYQDLSEEQDETNSPCNVDIFVVRPIIRNPGDTNQELYYLIMNDEPWSTANDGVAATR